MARSTGFWLALLSCVLLSMGCGGGSDGRMAVSGSIQFKGAPLDQGSIEFHPQGEGERATFAGAPITNGKYTIPASQGLLPGKYLVFITSSDAKTKVEAAPGESGPLAKERIPARYNTSSKEFVEVKAGATNTFDYDIK